MIRWARSLGIRISKHITNKGRARCGIIPHLRICFGECLYQLALPALHLSFPLGISHRYRIPAVSIRLVLPFVLLRSDVNRLSPF